MARPNHNSNGNTTEELPKVKFSKDSIRESLWIFKYVRPYKGQFIGGLIFIALSSITTMSFLFLLQKLIDSVDGLHVKGYTITPGMIAVTMVVLLLLQMLVSFMRVYLFTSVGERALGDLRKDIYNKMITMSMDFFAQRRVGELSSRLSADVSQIQDTVTTVLAEVLRGVLVLVIGTCAIFFISSKLAFMMLSVVPVIVVVAVVFGKRIRKVSRSAQDKLADSGTIVQETLQGISNVKSFNNEWYEKNRYIKSIDDVVAFAVKNGRFRGLFVSFLLFSVFGAIVLVIWYGAGLMQQGQLTYGDLTGFVLYTTFVGGTMAGFADMYSQLQKTLGATQRVKEILLEQSENVDVSREQLNEQYKLKGHVNLSHIAFSYPTRAEVPVLKDVSISARPGEQIAIVGPSGAGKSTLVSLLLRFYEPSNGSITFDDKDAHDIPLSQLRMQMALVPQDVMLFGGTIFENIAYGKPGASQHEVEEAAKKANAHQFITSFPEGYETIVGERGIKLSGGQRQRIAIARAILKDPVILILDEATSSLDSESEQLVQEALNNLMKNRTSFVIAHRLATIRNADKIVVLEHGVVRESGTHQELLALENGLYKSLSRLQTEWH
jgi:ABC-type multidrug transport system, ATPase and permease components